MRDCLLTMYYGVKRMREKGFTMQQILARRTGMNVSEFISSPFEGSSGQVTFDEFGDRVNVINGTLVNTFLSEPNGTLVKLNETRFHGGSLIPPLDGIVLTRSVVDYTSAIGTAMIILHMAGAAVCIGSVVLLVVKRRSATVKHMSLPLLLVACMGVGVEYFSVFGWLGRFEENMACGVQQWVGWVGFSVFMQGVLPKLWRIYRIFDNKKIMQNRRHLRDDHLLPLSLPITLINAILLAFWSLYDPLLPVQISNPTEFHHECRSRSPIFQNLMNYLLMTYNGLLILAAITLAYLTRNATSAYRETIYVLYASQTMLLCAIIVVGLTFGVFGAGGAWLATLYMRVILGWIATTVAFVMTVGRSVLAVFIASFTGADRDSTAETRKDQARRLGPSGPPAHSPNPALRRNLNGSIPVGLTDVFASSIAERSALMDGDGGIDLAKSRGCPFLPSSAASWFSVTVPVKDGMRVLGTWEIRNVIWTDVAKYLVLADPRTSAGECVHMGSPDVQMTKSKCYADCVELRFGTRVRILQLPDAEAIKSFLTWFNEVHGALKRASVKSP
ncbi:hypothetical protein HDU96_001287 [Phlyctochytrium bullatum]|nr:hypothetical protein HDU96_001287 [Phlyctochytrium bullatum]